MDNILSQASCLTSISATHRIRFTRDGLTNFEKYLSIPWSGIEQLANITGPNMVYLSDITVPALIPTKSPALFSRFSALRELGCTFKVNLDIKGLVLPEWLPNLEVLRLRDCHSSFFDMLTILK